MELNTGLNRVDQITHNKLILCLIIITIILFFVFVITKLFVINDDDYADNIRYLIETLVATQAAILSVVLSMAFVAAQIVMSSFSIQHVKTIIKIRDILIIILVYIFLVLFEIFSLIRIEKSFDEFIYSGNIAIGIFSICLFVILIWFILKSLQIEEIIKKIQYDIKKKFNSDDLDELFCIINNSISKKASNLAINALEVLNNYQVTPKNTDRVKRSICNYIKKTYEKVYQSFISDSKNYITITISQRFKKIIQKNNYFIRIARDKFRKILRLYRIYARSTEKENNFIQSLNSDNARQLHQNIIKSYELALKFNETQVRETLFNHYKELFENKNLFKREDIEHSPFMECLDLIEWSLEYKNDKSVTDLSDHLKNIIQKKGNLPILHPDLFKKFKSVLSIKLDQENKESLNTLILFIKDIWEKDLAYSIEKPSGKSIIPLNSGLLIEYIQFLSGIGIMLIKKDQEKELFLILGSFHRLSYSFQNKPEILNSIIWSYEKLALIAIECNNIESLKVIIRNLMDLSLRLLKSGRTKSDFFIIHDPLFELVCSLETIICQSFSIEKKLNLFDVFEEILFSIHKICDWAITVIESQFREEKQRHCGSIYQQNVSFDDLGEDTGTFDLMNHLLFLILAVTKKLEVINEEKYIIQFKCLIELIDKKCQSLGTEFNDSDNIKFLLKNYNFYVICLKALSSIDWTSNFKTTRSDFFISDKITLDQAFKHLIKPDVKYFDIGKIKNNSEVIRVTFESAWPIWDYNTIEDAIIVALRKCEERLFIISDYVKTRINFYPVCPICQEKNEPIKHSKPKYLIIGDCALISLKHTLLFKKFNEEDNIEISKETAQIVGQEILHTLLRNVTVSEIPAKKSSDKEKKEEYNDQNSLPVSDEIKPNTTIKLYCFIKNKNNTNGKELLKDLKKSIFKNLQSICENKEDNTELKIQIEHNITDETGKNPYNQQIRVIEAPCHECNKYNEEKFLLISDTALIGLEFKVKVISNYPESKYYTEQLIMSFFWQKSPSLRLKVDFNDTIDSVVNVTNKQFQLCQ